MATAGSSRLISSVKTETRMVLESWQEEGLLSNSPRPHRSTWCPTGSSSSTAIVAGEEIRTDYGEAYWEGLPWGWVAIANALIALRLLAHHRSGKPD